MGGWRFKPSVRGVQAVKLLEQRMWVKIEARERMQRGDWLFRLLPVIPIFLLRTQKGKCLQHRTWSSELILRHLWRLICTIVFGIDWFYYYLFLNHSCLFNFELFPFIPGRLGNAVKCLSLWKFHSGRQVEKVSVVHVISYFGKLVGGHGWNTFCP